ncbi:MAG TPA: hypothetical protein VF008_21525 [Niastella sp.]
MHRNEQPVSVGNYVAMLLVLLSINAVAEGLVSDPKWYWLLCITIPILLIYAYIIRR